MVAAAVAVAAMGFWAYSATQSADSVASQLNQAQAQKLALDQQVAALSVYSQRQQAEAAQAAVVDQLATARIDWERLVRDVITVLPSGVWVSTINGTLPTTATSSPGSNSAAAPGTLQQPNTNAPQGLHIVGDAFTQGEVADTMARLATVPGLGTPRLAASQATPTSTKTIIAFTIDIPVNSHSTSPPGRWARRPRRRRQRRGARRETDPAAVAHPRRHRHGGRHADHVHGDHLTGPLP